MNRKLANKLLAKEFRATKEQLSMFDEKQLTKSSIKLRASSTFLNSKMAATLAFGFTEGKDPSLIKGLYGIRVSMFIIHEDEDKLKHYVEKYCSPYASRKFRTVEYKGKNYYIMCEE